MQSNAGNYGRNRKKGKQGLRFLKCAYRLAYQCCVVHCKCPKAEKKNIVWKCFEFQKCQHIQCFTNVFVIDTVNTDLNTRTLCLDRKHETLFSIPVVAVWVEVWKPQAV